MTKLKYFIFGFLFVSFVNPIIEGVCELILTWLESFKGNSTLKVTKINSEIRKAALVEALEEEGLDKETVVFGFTGENKEASND